MALPDQEIELVEAGVSVIRLYAGESDFDTLTIIAEAGINAIREGHTRSTSSAGTMQIRTLIYKKLKGKFHPLRCKTNENDISYATDDIAISNGAKKSTLQAVLAIYFPRDEVEKAEVEIRVDVLLRKGYESWSMNRVGKCGQNHRLDAFSTWAILVYLERMNNERLYVTGHCYGGGFPYRNPQRGMTILDNVGASSVPVALRWQ
ncbi:bifunctional aspartate aminotransferase and glutamate/aspartate-prephenate aminotransferase [Artemisia annua]|uniref:Bifunctional aspartate aminotransferase and glutamate/aspartate-prephenate aminotransferase n=1 Tax=Artemisia annua TaxID=35608 RepID=A0A2U1NJE0_ARTAN|nr:bifunctional aspartate aminotransferase and glutamate/aspartate-prephenate aminotransferase [Artemisia annua]